MMLDANELKEKEQAVKAQLKDNLLKLQKKNEELMNSSKKFFDSSNIQEVNSALSYIFKDGLAIFNRIAEHIYTQMNKTKMQQLEEKSALFDTLFSELTKNGELSESMQGELSQSSKFAEKFLKAFKDESQSNEALKDALGVLASFNKEVKEGESKEEQTKQASDTDFDTDKLDMKDTQKSYPRNKQNMRQRA